MRVPRPTVRRLASLALLSALVFGAGAGTSVVAIGQDRGSAREERPAPRTDRSEHQMGGAAGEERAEGGAKVKVFEFTGLDISGRLKSPQLLYFLNRLRTEFGRPKLPHRSFVPELVRSTKGKAF